MTRQIRTGDAPPKLQRPERLSSRRIGRRLTALLLSAPVVAIIAPRLGAQADPDSVRQRNECRLAAQVLQTGHPAPERQQALTVIGRCGSAALPIVGDVWEHGALDSLETETLITSTRPYPADTLARLLLHVAETSGRPQVVRLGALRVLVTFADPNRTVRLEDLTRSNGRVVFATLDHPVPQVNRDQLTLPLRDLLRVLAERLARNDADPVMRAAGGQLVFNFR